MAAALTDVEQLCQQALQALETHPRAPPGDLTQRIHALLPRLAESKKKIMIRSARGQELTKAIEHYGSQLYDAIRRLSPDDAAGDAVATQLKALEDSVQNLIIYWKSFEYATT
jgi:hypothetical protein